MSDMSDITEYGDNEFYNEFAATAADNSNRNEMAAGGGPGRTSRTCGATLSSSSIQELIHLIKWLSLIREHKSPTERYSPGERRKYGLLEHNFMCIMFGPHIKELVSDDSDSDSGFDSWFHWRCTSCEHKNCKDSSYTHADYCDDCNEMKTLDSQQWVCSDCGHMNYYQDDDWSNHCKGCTHW